MPVTLMALSADGAGAPPNTASSAPANTAAPNAVGRGSGQTSLSRDFEGSRNGAELPAPQIPRKGPPPSKRRPLVIPGIPVPAPPNRPTVTVPADAPTKSERTVAIDTFEDIVAVGSATAFHCSGVLVAPRRVLTARHCIPASRVLIGYDVHMASRVAPVANTVAPDDPHLDVALLELAEDVTMAPRARRGAADTLQPIGMVRLMGFGSNDSAGKRGFGRKRYADVNVFGWGCDATRAAQTGCRASHEMVIPRRSDRDTCAGDSGGPVFEEHGGQWRLVAITSRPLPGSRVLCGDGGIYTRVDRIAPWLEKQLGGHAAPRRTP
jgi:hypothetical protein